jgi:hypothetical protein
MAEIVWDEKPIPGGKTDPIPPIEEPKFVAPHSGTITYTNFQKLDATAKVAFIARGGIIAGL